MVVIPLELVIAYAVLSLLTVLDRLLKMTTGKSSIGHIRSKLHKHKEKVENSIKSIKGEGSIMDSTVLEIADIEDLVENLIDLSEKLEFK